MVLEEFLASSYRNHHLVEPGFDVLYVRRSRRWLNNQFYDTFDIANVSTSVPGTGTFTRFLERLRAATTLPIFVENVFNNRFAAWLCCHGFEYIYPLCYVDWRDNETTLPG